MCVKSNVWVLLLVAVAGVVGCADRERDTEVVAEAAKTGSPVQLGVRVVEASGIKTTTPSRQDVPSSLATFGWLAAMPGRQIVVRAPITGYVAPADGAQSLALGQSLRQGNALGTLQGFLSPQDAASLVAAKEDADTVIRQSLATLETARGQLARLEHGAADAVRGTRLQQLRETIARAQAAHDEAREKLPFLPAEPYGEMPRLKPTILRSPLTGRIVQLAVTPGQLVLQGAPLCTVADWSVLWIRVPVFVGDLPRIVRQAAADVTVPGSHKVRKAAPLTLPLATEPRRQTVTVSYRLDNTRGDLRPGQAVAVALPTGKTAPRWTIPTSAVLWDGQGNAWVYVGTGPGTYRRQRVELGRFLVDRVVVRRGVQADDNVVTVGAETLYGEEFRAEIPTEAEEDD